MSVPKTSSTLLPGWIMNIPFKQYGTRGCQKCSRTEKPCWWQVSLTRPYSRENHVTDLHHTGRTSCTSLNDNFGVVLVLECASASENHGPCFANNLGPSRNGDSIGDVVVTGIEEDYLASGVLHVCMTVCVSASDVPIYVDGTADLIEHILDSCSVVCATISLRTLAHHADELANGVVYVLGMGFPKYSTRRVQKRGGLVCSHNVSLCKCCCTAGAREDISLSPGRYWGGTACKNSGSPVDPNRDGDIVQFDVI